LMDVKVEGQISVGRKVIVIGGGNVALDAARTSLRLGAEEVHLFYRRTREEMLVTPVEFQEGQEEGIQFHFLVSPTRIVKENQKVIGLDCIRMKLGTTDEKGRRIAIPVEGSEFFVKADTVIPSVGQAPDLSFLPRDSKLERARWGTLTVDSNSLSTNIPGVFAGGDFITGPTYVINAIASGRRAALAIDKYLKKDATRVEIRDEKALVDSPITGFLSEEEQSQNQQRITMATVAPEVRKKGFQEIELGYSLAQAREEARRCLRCDLEK
jgi:NADPH-dependent glutamate synthase beta subunit-like oxidoreductase